MFTRLQNERSISGLSRLTRLTISFYYPSDDTAVKSAKPVGCSVNTYAPQSFHTIRVLVRNVYYLILCFCFCNVVKVNIYFYVLILKIRIYFFNVS